LDAKAQRSAKAQRKNWLAFASLRSLAPLRPGILCGSGMGLFT
jgi:hypothetical protein